MILPKTTISAAQVFEHGFPHLQILFLAVVAVGGWHWSVTENARPLTPLLTERPRSIRPLFDYPLVISDGQLTAVLHQLHPNFEQQPVKINFIDHAIRMWGDQAEFADDSYSGKHMRELLLNHQVFSSSWGPHARPLLRRGQKGIYVTTQEGRSSVSHEDHLMGTLAETGLPLSFPVTTATGTGTVSQLLENAIKTFRINQREYEWSALSAACYAVDGRPWFTSEGQSIDFNALANRLMRQRQPQGVCYGQHRLYTLTLLLRIDEQMREENVAIPMLSSETRETVFEYLMGMTRRFYTTQSLQGHWDGNWPDKTVSIPDPETDELSRRLLATGHVLEWWAMAPVELHPPRETIVRASQWLARTIIEMEPARIEKNYTFLSHAGRALAMWRGCFPAEFERRAHPAPAPRSSAHHIGENSITNNQR